MTTTTAPTPAASPVVRVDEALVAEAAGMRRRAESLRHEAAEVDNELVARSFLDASMKATYSALLAERAAIAAS